MLAEFHQRGQARIGTLPMAGLRLTERTKTGILSIMLDTAFSVNNTFGLILVVKLPVPIFRLVGDIYFTVFDFW